MTTLTPASIIAIIGALAADELAKIRKTDPQLWKGRQWKSDTIITTAGHARGEDNEIQVDSFEWMSIASRVVDFFQLDSTGLEDYLLRVSSLGQWAEVVATSREQGSKNITFSTSGSSGQPQKHEQQWQDLVREAQFFADFASKQSIQIERIISAVPPHHIYGFIFSVLLPELIEKPVTRGLKAFTTTQGQRLKNGDLLVGFPTWDEPLAAANVGFPEGANAGCSSGPVAAETLQRLQQAGLANILEVYGSTETSGLGLRLTRNGWYQLLPRWQRVDNNHVYDKANERTVDLPDDIDWLDTIQFKPLARKDSAVQVNGYNVYPERVADMIRQHPNIKTARVRVVSEAQSGGLKALLVGAGESVNMPSEALIAQIQSWLASRLDDAEMPRRYVVADSVPVNDMGKEVDWDVQADIMDR